MISHLAPNAVEKFEILYSVSFVKRGVLKHRKVNILVINVEDKFRVTATLPALHLVRPLLLKMLKELLISMQRVVRININPYRVK